jgi:benzylsuccinate CoA-transferase BbsF subunit
MNELPLKGYRILDLGIVLAGPYAAMMLGDLGADVIRVESTHFFAPMTRGPMAHPTRELLASMAAISGGYPDREPGERPWNRFPWFNAAARNKRGVTMDLTRLEGVELFAKLVRVADVLVSNQSPGMAKRLGVDFDRLVEINPGLVYVNASLFGSQGRFALYKGTGGQMEAFVGHDALRHYRDSDVTTNSWMVPSDAAGGAAIALSALLGLFARDQTGEGQYIDISMVENELALLGPLVLESELTGAAPAPRGNRSRCAVQGCYPCAGEDRWLTITTGNAEAWRGLATLIGRADLAERTYDEKLWSESLQDEIDDAIARWTRRQDRDTAVELLLSAGIWSGPVLPDSEIVDDPHLAARDHFMSLDQVDTGRYPYPGPPFRLRASEPFPANPPVRLGEHNEEIYSELLGLSSEEIRRFREMGQIGDSYGPEIP